MTRDKKFKQVVRARQRQTGVRYTEARAEVAANAPPAPPEARRIFGLETTYTVRFTGGRSSISPAEISRFMFRRIVSWGRSSNVYLDNGANLRLGEGGLPDYATPECDSVRDVVAYDKAGERLIARLAEQAGVRLSEEGLDGRIDVYKTSPGGSHENYLVPLDADFARYADLIPFFVTRQCFAGSGGVLQTSRGALYCLSPRAEQIWSATPTILSIHQRPLADPDRYRRLHVSVGDSNMSEVATFTKIGATAILLGMIDDGARPPNVALENPIRALREISHDPSCTRTVRLADGRMLSAVQIQELYVEQAHRWAERGGLPDDLRQSLDLWERLSRDPSAFPEDVDWVRNQRLIEDGVEELHALGSDVASVVTADEISRAEHESPASTRANVRARFIRAARTARRDYTVDWTHLKLNDQAQRTIVCNDPFMSDDPRVDRLIASLTDR